MLKDHKKAFYIVLIVLLALCVGGIIYLSFFYSPTCGDYECWQKYMTRCSRVHFVNEGAEASWGYTILGPSGKQCLVNVKLLLAKKGDLGINNLIGEDMTCSFPLGSVAYPESDLSKCHGILKEDLQTIIINKLHAYLLENLGQISSDVQKAI